MLVQATEEMGENSIPLTDSTQIPIMDQPSTSSQPKKKQKSRRKQRKEAETAHVVTEEEEHLTTPSNDPLPSEKAKSNQAIEIASLKKRVDKLEKRRQLRTTRLTRFKKLGTARRVKSSNDGLGAQQNEDLMFNTGVLDDDEVFVDVASSEKNEQSTKALMKFLHADIGVSSSWAKIDELPLAQTLN
ncbi:hypothetical protein Tco_0973457 [Tanacetum coccineum]